jgi:CHASE3 domain sensor protein
MAKGCKMTLELEKIRDSRLEELYPVHRRYSEQRGYFCDGWDECAEHLESQLAEKNALLAKLGDLVAERQDHILKVERAYESAMELNDELRKYLAERDEEILKMKSVLEIANETFNIIIKKNPNAVNQLEAADMAVEFHMGAIKAQSKIKLLLEGEHGSKND